MKKTFLIGMMMVMTASAFAGNGEVGSVGSSAYKDKLGLAVLQAAVNCKIVGMDLESCDPSDKTTVDLKITKEINRCEMLNDNLLYCLTTSSDSEVLDVVQRFAQSVYNSKKIIRDSFASVGALPQKDKAGLISAWHNCQLAGIAPSDCN